MLCWFIPVGRHCWMVESGLILVCCADKADRVNDPPKFAQDMEITRLAFPDSYKDRDHERFASSFGDMDTSLCGKWPVLRDLLAVWKAKGDKVGRQQRAAQCKLIHDAAGTAILPLSAPFGCYPALARHRCGTAAMTLPDLTLTVA